MKSDEQFWTSNIVSLVFYKKRPFETLQRYHVVITAQKVFFLADSFAFCFKEASILFYVLISFCWLIYRC